MIFRVLLLCVAMSACAKNPTRIPARDLAERLATEPDRYAVVDVRSRDE